MPQGPRILVSLGAQKAATTWLSQYLVDHPQCDRTPLKENHYFDYFDRGLPDLGRGLIKKRRRRLLRRGKANPKLRRSKGFRRANRYFGLRLAATHLGPPNYDAYEALVMSAATKRTKIIGEITPANGLLTVERLQGIAALDSNPLFILIMRDPVDRTWSGIRMMAERQTNGEGFEARAHEMLAEFVNSDDGEIHIRTDYATMLNKADAAIPEDRIFIDFFEEFLNQPKIDRLCDFLGVNHHPADLGTPQLLGKSLKMTDDERRALSAKLRPIYNAVEKRMGRLPDRWIQNRDLA